MLKFQTLNNRSSIVIGNERTIVRHRSSIPLSQLFDVDETNNTTSKGCQALTSSGNKAAVNSATATTTASLRARRNSSAQCLTLPRPLTQPGLRAADSKRFLFSSTPGTERRCNRNGRSTSVSSLSSSSSGDSGVSSSAATDWGTIRIYCNALRADCDYKTFFASKSATALELVQLLLEKLNVNNLRDLNLCSLVMEIRTVHEGTIITNRLQLDKNSRPLELQGCHPMDRTRFVAEIHKGYMVKIFDASIVPESNYKSLIVSAFTTCTEVITMLLQIYECYSTTSADDFEIVLIETNSGYEHYLLTDDILLDYQRQPWWSDHYQFHLRPLKRINILSIPVYNNGQPVVLRRPMLVNSFK